MMGGNRVGIITSSGGATINAAFQILSAANLEFDFKVVTDRNCGSEKVAEVYGYESKQILYSDKFDLEAKKYLFDELEVELAILLHSRLIKEVLFATGKCVNIHPSLLPAFSGLNATRQAYLKHVRYIGVTSHFVDEGIDTGEIISQCILPVYKGESLEQINRKSHYMRVYAFLQILEVFFPDACELSEKTAFKSGPLGNPGLRNTKTLQSFRNYAEDIPELGNFL
jgi:folate-dependent phosphoribosylglycinamide formyltransferase PurN